MDSPNRSLLTSREAAAMLGVERRTLIRMEESGALVPVRLHAGANRRYRRTDILELVGGNTAA